MRQQHRYKNWNLSGHEIGDKSFNVTHEDRVLAVLMDIREELQTLNDVFRCHNALAIPELLRAIKKNTTKRKRKAVKK